jgi:hypothetical protein
MKAVSVAVVSLSALALLVPCSLGAQQQPPPSPSGQQSAPRTPDKPPVAAASAPVPVYKPPLRGAPGGRVGGGTRGTGREVFVLSVLAPDHSGLTVSEQPSLYWFISTGTSAPVELTVTDPNAAQPLLELRIPPPVKAGVHRLRLTDHGVKLAPGIAYRWYVSVVSESGRRSRDVLAGGTIERADGPPGLGARVSQASRSDLPFIYADAGFWYDALAAVSDLIEAKPEDVALRKQRAALMAQVGLPEINE